MAVDYTNQVYMQYSVYCGVHVTHTARHRASVYHYGTMDKYAFLVQSLCPCSSIQQMFGDIISWYARALLNPKCLPLLLHCILTPHKLLLCFVALSIH